MLQEIINIIADELMLDKTTLKAETNLIEDLEADSLEIVEIIDAIEKRYNIYVEEEDVLSIQTIGDITDYLEKKLGK